MVDVLQLRSWFVPYIYAAQNYTLLVTPFGSLRVPLQLRTLAAAVLMCCLACLATVAQLRNRRQVRGAARAADGESATGHAHAD